MSRQTVLITGCSDGGIGYSLAKEFHRQGLRVLATARRLETMTALSALGVETFVLDVTNDASVKSLRATVGELLNGRGLDILVNNAGQAYTCPATDLDIARVKELFDANLFGAIRMVHDFVDLLVASGSGRIVQIGSVAGGKVPLAFGSAYNATKAAMHAYGDTLRVELAPFNIKVITIVTGGVKSNIVRPTGLPANSLYKRIEPLFKAFRVRHSQQGATDTDEYAQYVVKRVLRRNPSAWIWAGSNAWLVWFLDTFLWRTIFDKTMSRRFGLDELAKMIKDKQE